MIEQPKATLKDLAKLKTDILKTLRDDRDKQGQLIQSGTIIIDPQLLGKQGGFKLFGPYYFETSYKAAPSLTFGQSNHTDTKDTLVNISPESTLFLVIPYRANWVWTSGVVEGFYLGLYAVLEPPPGVKRHTISWQAVGKASYYKGGTLNETWTHPYENTQAEHLIQDDTNVDQE